MTISPNESVIHEDYYGRTFYFCSHSCAAKFHADPRRYAEPVRPGAVQEKSANQNEYTCPMHPEVRQAGPGDCPKCGMALEQTTAQVSAARAEYTCPMHPEIIRDAPGPCPICGMALEPREVTGEEANVELVGMTRRFWISLAILAPILSLMISEFLPGDPLTACVKSRKTPGLGNVLKIKCIHGDGHAEEAGKTGGALVWRRVA